MLIDASPWDRLQAACTMECLDEDDIVVAELDVLVSNELSNLQSHLVMLQQPLRPNWRPYDTDR